MISIVYVCDCYQKFNAVTGMPKSNMWQIAWGIGRSVITQIELGNRKITSDEIQKFCQLYHVSADYLLNQESLESKQVVFARGFEELNENDQQEILNLIAFKKSMAGL